MKVLKDREEVQTFASNQMMRSIDDIPDFDISSIWNETMLNANRLDTKGYAIVSCIAVAER